MFEEIFRPPHLFQDPQWDLLLGHPQLIIFKLEEEEAILEAVR